LDPDPVYVPSRYVTLLAVGLDADAELLGALPLLLGAGLDDGDGELDGFPPSEPCDETPDASADGCVYTYPAA
jgi:hypothetical protein